MQCTNCLICMMAKSSSKTENSRIHPYLKSYIYNFIFILHFASSFSPKEFIHSERTGTYFVLLAISFFFAHRSGWIINEDKILQHRFEFEASAQFLQLQLVYSLLPDKFFRMSLNLVLLKNQALKNLTPTHLHTFLSVCDY